MTTDSFAKVSGCQQHEPTEASWQNIANRSRNLLASARGGCQKKGFKAYLQTQDSALDELYNLAREKRCALLCFEADAQFCHRSLVGAEMIRRYGVEIIHADVKAAKNQTMNQLQPELLFS